MQAYLSCTQQPQAQYAALASLSGAISFDLANYIGQLSLPTAVILGEKSRFMPPAVGRRLASLNPPGHHHHPRNPRCRCAAPPGMPRGGGAPPARLRRDGFSLPPGPMTNRTPQG
ncbi:MAG: alpha/beta fold hydrolase [Nodosilinea sp.]